MLVRGLARAACTVECFDNGTDGVWAEAEGNFDVVLLDLLLPGMSGYQVCEAIRARGSTVPILVLTAKSGEYDQIDLLDLGADDFMTKPVSIELLEARLRALVRRTAGSPINVLSCGDLSFDLDSRRCAVGDVEVELTSKEVDVLLALLRDSPSVVSRIELLRGVWGLDFDGDPGAVDVYLNRLRKKIGSERIETVRGVGFRVVA